jgi:hypothetical protein
MSQQNLADQLAEVGCALPQSAISKIENPMPGSGGRRGISVDEAIAFARVFKLSLGELLLPPDTERHMSAYRHVIDGPRVARELHEAQARYEEQVAGLAQATVHDAVWAGQLADMLEGAIREDQKTGKNAHTVKYLTDALEFRAKLQKVTTRVDGKTTKKRRAKK